MVSRAGHSTFAWLLASACTAACQPGPRSRQPAAARATPAATRAPAANSAVSAEPAPTPLPPRPLPDACYSDVDPSGPARDLLERLTSSCVSGMTPLLPPFEVHLQAGAASSLPFDIVDPGRCIRVAAAGASPIEQLQLQILDASDRIVGENELPGPIALANPDGPLCLPGAGGYRAVIRASVGGGPAALQIWQAD